MAKYIPFVTGVQSARLVREFYEKAAVVRLSLDRLDGLRNELSGMNLWIDPAVDGMDDVKARVNSSWFGFMQGIDRFEDVGDQSFWLKPDNQVVSTFVKSILDRCNSASPQWLTVPQLPQIDGTDRNKINRALAAATGNWKRKSRYSGRLILPLVFTNQQQLNGKTERNRKIDVACKCYDESISDGLWIVDKSLEDDSGSSTLRAKRFPGIISFHQELNERIAARIQVSGPYWALNIVLWARGLVSHAAIGIGAGYQYFLPGSPQMTPTARLALSPLRRRAVVDASLKGWLSEAVSILPPSHPAQQRFSKLLKQHPVLADRAAARRQVARFYRDWWGSIASTPPPGRSMALFQDLSGAYALGKLLPEITPKGTDRRPEAVVEPLMMSCL